MMRESLRLVPDPGLRYLRGRGNRRVRKVNRLRSLLRMRKAVVADLVLAALLVFGCVRAVQHLASSTSFTLRTIQVDGTSRTTPEIVRAKLEGFLGRNLLDLDLDEVTERSADDPWVLSASVKRLLPHTLRVVVTERTPAALAVVHGVVQVVDATGTPIGPVGPDFPEDLPVLTGLTRLTGDALSDALLRGVRAVRRLEETTGGWIEQVSELDLSQADRIGVVTRTPGPLVLLDPEDVERNVGSYLDLRGEIEEKLGPVASVDLRWRDRISVLPVHETEAESD